MHWIDNLGGPLVAIEDRLLNAWHGATGFPALDTHYDRACQIRDYLGVVAVSSGSALVLGDEPMTTSWLPNQRWGAGLIVRWMYASNEGAVLRELTSLPDILFADPVVWQVGDDGQVLFDSALNGPEGPDRAIQLSLLRGAYRVDTCVYKPDDEMCLVLHRVQRHGH